MDSGSTRRGISAGGGTHGGRYSLAKRYVKKKLIKQSLYGSVYLGLDTMTNQEVVIKSSDRVMALTKTLPDGSPSKEDIKEEIRIHKKLSNDPEPCPFIIKMLDVVQNRYTIDLVLEYAPGGDLFIVMKYKTEKLNLELEELRGTPEYNELLSKHWEEVLKLIKQILQATAYLHARNISHRDLSLENIMLDSNGNVKIIDFGNAWEYADTNWLSERGPIGKPGYLSPECFANEFYDGRDNDMWCNGVILWQMLIGAKLWYDPESGDARFKHVYFEGLQGLQRLLKIWNLSDRLPPYCSDFIIKIFCPQKCRLTVKEALAHPYITNAAPDDEFILRDVPVQMSLQPDYHLKRLAHLTRYERVEIPQSWAALNQEKRQKIINQLAGVNKNRLSTVLDQSVVLDVARDLHLEFSEARAIIHYLWASSQHPSRVQFPDPQRTEGSLDGGAKNHNLRRRGYDVDNNEDQKCDLSIHENLDVEQALPAIPHDKRSFGDTREQCKPNPSGILAARLSRNSQLMVDHQRSQSGDNKRTHNRLGGSLVATKGVSKYARGQGKLLGRRQRKIGRCVTLRNEQNPKEFEHITEGDEPRIGRRNSRVNRAMYHRENHPELIRKRGKYKYRSRKLRRPTTGDAILSCTDLAEV